MTFQALYGFPARKLKIIGITGTDGKTTTSSLIYHILKTAGKKVSIITSVSAIIGGKELDTGFHVTTPDPHDIPKYLAQSVDNGDEYFVLEITSHGLDQHRAAGVQFEIAGITNITHEHLGYHGTFQNYVRAKSTIARMSRRVIVNADQPDVMRTLHECNPSTSYKTFGLKEKADYSLDISDKFHISLEEYNKSNYLLAYAICSSLGVNDESFDKAIHTFRTPSGRMEVIHQGEFTVISDFAHTPNALANALSAVRAKYPQHKRLIHVFGAAAYRDDSKRVPMGEVSATYADIIILTEEDYRTEDPQRIFSMLEQGIQEKGFTEIPSISESSAISNSTYMKILQREEAIHKAISIALPGDIVMITGKGVEKSLCRGNKEYPYDEKEAVRQALTHVKTALT